jgi:hypothetical protein
MTGRDPDAVLAELGASLRAAWDDGDRRRRRRRVLQPARAAMATAVLLALVPTALATRNAIWSDDAPPAPEQLRAPDARPAGPQVYVASGRAGGVDWRLSAASCGPAVGVFLTVPGGGGGARCDVGAAPDARNRTYAYYDPGADRTWIFGVAPAAARSVEAGGHRVAAVLVPDEAIRRGRLHPGMRVYVVALSGSRELPQVRILDGTGEVLETCAEGSCEG